MFKFRRRVRVLVAAGAALLLVSACTGSNSSAQQKAVDANNKLQDKIYQLKNNIEFNNYNDRQKISDDLTTILWCTIVYSNPNVKPITVPIVGKLTSSEKRPYATSRVESKDSSYTPEVPGPDRMFGASAPYRYGFTPAHVYFDFSNVESTCTTQPTVYQATETTVVLKIDKQLNAAAQAARAALQQGINSDGTISKQSGDKAQQILEQASGGSK